MNLARAPRLVSSCSVKSRFLGASPVLPSTDNCPAISVTWSGGGSIKDPTQDWNINTLKQAAAAFPDLVAITPQRTYAILTKYTSLASFHEHKQVFTPLDYESAGIYTRALLDSYMDYKAMWKQISHATYELKGNRATIEMAKPTEETTGLARILLMPPTVNSKGKTDDECKALEEAKEAKAKEEGRQAMIVAEPIDKSQDPEDALKKALTTGIQYRVFSASFAGLIHARKVCRFEMAKIVNEVDLVAKNPKLSTDPTRDAYFLNPLVFEQLLPVSDYCLIEALMRLE